MLSRSAYWHMRPRGRVLDLYGSTNFSDSLPLQQLIKGEPSREIQRDEDGSLIQWAWER